MNQKAGLVSPLGGFGGLLCISLCLACPIHSAFAQERKIIFGGEYAYPPFEWDDRGAARGFNIDLENAIAEVGGVEYEHRLNVWPVTLRALEAGDVDVVPMFYSAQRAQKFAFTPPFQFVDHNIFGAVGSARISSIEELSTYRVAVEEASYAQQTIAEQEGLQIELVLTPTTLSALEAVAGDRADYAVLAAPTANYLIRTRTLPLESVSLPFWPRSYGFAVQNDRVELSEWLTQRLYEVLRSGTYDQIYSRWEDHLAPTTQRGYSRLVVVALISAMLVAVVGLVWVWRLRRTLIANTRDALREAKQRRSAEARARWVANHNPDTDLPRQQFFMRRVSQLLSRAKVGPDQPIKQVVAIKLADLDKTIRTFGHKAGATALRCFADQLRAMKFEALGQIGRDVILIFADKGQIDSELRAVASLRDTLVLNTQGTPRLFAGVATWPAHGSSLADLLKSAETALAVAVETRQSWVEYRPSMQPDGADLELLEIFQKTAGAGLYSVYQPQIDIQSGRVVGAEALARWDAQGIGPVSPERFIPLLEDAGIIRHVTTRMLRESIRLAADLRRAGCPCPLSVNVAISDLLGEKLQKTVFDTLRAHKGEARDLRLEITETSFTEQSEAIRSIIAKFLEDGIDTSIDDFGTGYSSLSYLSDFPIKEVKIDRSFVNGMTRKPEYKSIVHSTITMAHELCLLVVAEGVETEAELKMLRRLGCDRAQGYLISKPLREKEFMAFLQSPRAT